ncbi:MAG TPA: peptidase S8 [Planctomycetes bacterium]|nr:peptidase S8 [Planctomycetota bacterium]
MLQTLSPALVLCAFLGTAQAAPQTSAALSSDGHELRLGDGTLVYQSQNKIHDLEQIRLPGSSALVLRWQEDQAAGALTRYRIRLAGRSSFGRVRTLRPQVHLQRGSFDPLVDPAPAAPEGLTDSGNLRLVQFKTEIIPAYREALQQAGAVLRAFLPEQTLLVELGQGPGVDALAALDCVRWVGDYPASYRLEAELLAGWIEGTLPGRARLRIQVLERGPGMKAVVAQRLVQMGATIDAMIPDGFVLEATLDPNQLAQAATWDEVLWIDRWSLPADDMDKVRVDSGANYVESVAGFSGNGVRAECMDGNLDDSHPDLQSNPAIFHGSHSGSASHGTPVTGVVFGDGAGSSTRRGMLPDGQPIFADYGSFGGNRYTHTAELLQSPYNAVFQTNSWGSSLTSSYNSISSEMDDILFINDIVILQSQSNTGNTSSRPQAWAKNIVSVGGIRHQDSQTLSDDSWNGAGSTGPAEDGRIKPDLGYWYDSIAAPADGGGTTQFGGTSAATPMTAGAFGLMYEMWHAGIFGNSTGSSVFNSRPKATTARALMINSASSYSFSGTNADLTRVHQGWGRANVQGLYDLRDDMFIVNEELVLAHGESIAYPLTVDGGQPRLAVTLVYLDPMGTTSSGQHRINDLSLKVTAPGGAAFYWGNNGLTSGNDSTSGGSSNSLDVVENVFVSNPAAGVWSVEIFADEVNQDAHLETGALDVDFALVVSGTSGLGGVACSSPVTYCDPGSNSWSGSGATLLWTGGVSVANNNLEFFATGVPGNQFGLFFFGPNQVSLPVGNGTICVGGNLVRMPVIQADGLGTASQLFDLSSAPLAGAVVSGVTWNFQFWYRDPVAGGAGFDFSQAVQISWCD